MLGSANNPSIPSQLQLQLFYLLPSAFSFPNSFYTHHLFTSIFLIPTSLQVSSVICIKDLWAVSWRIGGKSIAHLSGSTWNWNIEYSGKLTNNLLSYVYKLSLFKFSSLYIHTLQFLFCMHTIVNNMQIYAISLLLLQRFFDGIISLDYDIKATKLKFKNQTAT